MKLKPSLSWMLIFVPVTAAVHQLAPAEETWIFLLASASIIPLAGWMGRATEHLADRTGEGIGGLLNATFGNAAEMIIAIMALRRGLTEVVKASLTGSILGNILLVLGASLFAGGLRFKLQRFNTSGARILATTLLLAAVGLVLPAAYHHLGQPHTSLDERTLSLEIAAVLLLTYFASLLFTLHTHKQLFIGPAAEALEVEEPGHERWSLGRSIGTLLGATALVAWMSEILVGAVEGAAHDLGMTDVFIGVVVVAVIGNAAEHSTAVLMALKNRMDLSLGIAIGSSVQVALFVAPVLVFLSYFLGAGPMDLVFSPFEVLAVVVGVLVTAQIAGDGESNWLEGLQLLVVYVILALAFYFLPAAAH